MITLCNDQYFFKLYFDYTSVAAQQYSPPESQIFTISSTDAAEIVRTTGMWILTFEHPSHIAPRVATDEIFFLRYCEHNRTTEWIASKKI